MVILSRDEVESPTWGGTTPIVGFKSARDQLEESNDTSRGQKHQRSENPGDVAVGGMGWMLYAGEARKELEAGVRTQPGATSGTETELG